jgi:hypothetical protein
MFVRACEEAAKFTRPVVIAQRKLGGVVSTALGAFVALNADGWIVTAGHIFVPAKRFQEDQIKIGNYRRDIEAIDARGDIDAKRKRSLKARVPHSNDWIEYSTMWWGCDTAMIAESYVYPSADLAVCRLNNLDMRFVTAFPRFRRPVNAKQGTSVVKIGYPFHEISAEWDTAAYKFALHVGPFPLFPIEGIHTRYIDNGTSPEGFPVKFVESSSPGLRGQSGGPWLDADATVWAIQSSTQSYALGFTPEVMDGNRKIKEHQFLNVGIGVHLETLEAVFARHDISVDWADPV